MKKAVKTYFYFYLKLYFQRDYKNKISLNINIFYVYRGKPGQSSSNTSSDVINELSGNMFQKGTFFVSFF
jgi:hypothetical protein